MSIHICIFEDKKHSNFLPLSLSRPVFDLRIGCGTLRARLLDGLTSATLHLVCREYLAPLARAGSPRAAVNTPPTKATLFLNGRWLALGEERDRMLAAVSEGTVAVKGGYVVAARLPAAAAKDLSAYLLGRLSAGEVDRVADALRAAAATPPPDGKRASPGSSQPPEGGYEDEHAIGGDHFEEKLPLEIERLIERHGLRRIVLDEARLLSFPWQLVEFNADAIADDFARSPVRGQSDDSVVYPGVHVVAPEQVVIGEHAVVRAGAVLDASDGPIVIGDRAVIMPNATVLGPCFIGSRSIVNAGARILAGSSVGAVCKVGGEVSDTIFAAYSNKQHDGFLGNSYVGEWVNIGAATNNSDLKNNYSHVRMWCAGSERETGRQFLGLLMGDHSKTGINALINTGTVIGFNCNLYSSEMPPKFVPSFSWGHGEEVVRYALDRAMQTAAVVMERREVRFTPAHRELFEAIFRIGERAGWNV
ncbi:MAG TPA: putative sugar nucleotidyl transferase [Candidatus Krumholzibacteria bacterium]